MSGSAIIVTGGAGFIGSHTCLQLADKGYLPVVIDNLRTGHADAVKWGPFEKVDVRDSAAVARVIEKYRADTVLHFAAAAYVGESVQDPGLYYDNNVGGMISLLQAMQQAGAGKLVLSSSCATYGVPDHLPIREDTPQHPINPYGRTKLICEEMIRDHAVASGLQFAMLRYFNACGADPGGRLSERHDPETHLIPLALMAAAGRRPPLQVFGTDYDTPDGTCVRDYIHVCDLARAHVLAVQRLQEGASDIAVNLGTGQGHSILEIINAIATVTGRQVPWTAADRRPGDPPALVAATGEAQNILGFSARFPGLRDIIAHAAPGFGLEMSDDLCA